MNTLSKLAQKPSDKTIRLVRSIFAVLLIVIIYFWWNVTEVNFGLPTEIKYIVIIFPVIGLIRWILDPGIVRKGIWRWIITGSGVIMLFSSLFLFDDRSMPANTPPTTTSGEIYLGDLMQAQDTGSFTLSIDNWFGFFGFFLIFIGFFLNNKNITLKNERYGEKVTKIRV